MSRLEDITFLKMANNLRALSKCAKTQVAALAVKDGRILSNGVNGTPSGYINCNQIHVGDFDHKAHRAWADEHEIHAELNTALYAAKHGINIDGCTIYCTMMPCKQCSKNLINVGVKRIVYSSIYDRLTPEEQYKTTKFLQTCGVESEFIQIDEEKIACQSQTSLLQTFLLQVHTVLKTSAAWIRSVLRKF